jgi:hypothetical protein
MGVPAFMTIGITDGMLDNLPDPADAALRFFKSRPGKNDRG